MCPDMRMHLPAWRASFPSFHKGPRCAGRGPANNSVADTLRASWCQTVVMRRRRVPSVRYAPFQTGIKMSPWSIYPLESSAWRPPLLSCQLERQIGSYTLLGYFWLCSASDTKCSRDVTKIQAPPSKSVSVLRAASEDDSKVEFLSVGPWGGRGRQLAFTEFLLFATCFHKLYGKYVLAPIPQIEKMETQENASMSEG